MNLGLGAVLGIDLGLGAVLGIDLGLGLVLETDSEQNIAHLSQPVASFLLSTPHCSGRSHLILNQAFFPRHEAENSGKKTMFDMVNFDGDFHIESIGFSLTKQKIKEARRRIGGSAFASGFPPSS